ncbi:MAG TPA: M20/M25/M40 family metallo-hydrolase [Allosphingosinicella sp.]|jgi:hypothetical protein
MTKKAGATLLALLALLLLTLALKPMLVSVPAVPAAGDAGGFDTERAWARLNYVLGRQQPHPVDSVANDEVRTRLLVALGEMRLRPTTTDDLSCSGAPDDRTVSCARVRNVLVTLGPAEGKHLLFVSHYDSTPVGAGAADDGIGVAAMLETIALLKDRPLKRPVTFLFNEGEETGLLGARAFLENNPLAQRVDTLVNLESRGTTGPAIMFETSRPNGSALAAFAATSRHPVGNSLTTDFYRLIPNSTDVAVFDKKPWTILNFAIIGNETRYHSPDDRLENLDPRSLAHMGTQALALATRLAGSETPPPSQTSERLYADVLGQGLLVLPMWLGTALLWALLAGFAVLAWRRRKGVGRGAGITLLAMIDAGLTVFLLQKLIALFRAGEYWRAYPEALAFAVDATALTAAAAFLLLLARKAPREGLRIGFWLVFLLLGAILSLLAPGTAIFFLLPPLLALAGLLVPRGGRLLALLAWAALFLSWAPLLHLSQVLLDMDAAWMFAPVSLLILMPVLIEMKPLATRVPGRTAAGAILAIALLVWLIPAFAPAYTAERKQRMSLEYAWDADAKTARIFAYGDGGPPPAALAGRVQPGPEVPWSGYKRWSTQTSGPSIKPPVLEPLGKSKTAEGRLLTLRLRMQGAEVFRLRLPADTPLRAVSLNGVARRFSPGKSKADYVLRCHGRSCEGATVRLLIAGEAPVTATVIGMRSGLPASAAPIAQSRSALAQPQYSADASYVVARIRL